MTDAQADKLLALMKELLESQKRTETSMKEAVETLKDIYSLT